MEQFLSHMPNLQQLQLVVNCTCSHNCGDGDRWRLFIIEHLPLMRTFNFKFQLENVYRNIETLLDHFRTSFWLNEKRNWFVMYDSYRSVLFTVPHYARHSVSYSEIPVLPRLTTLPIEKHALLYNKVNEITFDSIKEKPLYCYTHVEKLILMNVKIDEAFIDLSQVQYLSINLSSWSLDMIVQLIRQSMPRLYQLSVNCNISLTCSTSIVPLQQIRILHLPFFAYSTNNKNFDWTQLFPRLERLSITVNSCHEMAFLIDRLDSLTYASFIINNCSLNARRVCWESRITKEWFIKNTRRLASLENHNFTCRFDDANIFAVYLWMTENNKQQTRVSFNCQRLSYHSSLFLLFFSLQVHKRVKLKLNISGLVACHCVL